MKLVGILEEKEKVVEEKERLSDKVTEKLATKYKEENNKITTAYEEKIAVTVKAIEQTLRWSQRAMSFVQKKDKASVHGPQLCFVNRLYF